MPELPADDAPYYFMSYAHTPPTRGRNAVDPNARIIKFHNDLSGLIMELTALPYGASPGFLDEEMDTGTEWREELFEQLNQCRVFLPMLNARYFRNDWTRKEWFAFSSRKVTGEGGGRTRQTGILPVNWAEYNRKDVPQPIRRSQAFRPRTFGHHPDLLTLIVEPRLGGEYWGAVNGIARAIVKTAETVTVGPSPFGCLADLETEFERSELGGTFKGKRR